jgi:hypothetical protein
MRRGQKRTNVVGAAVELAGGVSKVSRELDVSRQTIYNWIAAGDMMRARYCDVLALSRLSGVSVEKLTAHGD